MPCLNLFSPAATVSLGAPLGRESNRLGAMRGLRQHTPARLLVQRQGQPLAKECKVIADDQRHLLDLLAAMGLRFPPVIAFAPDIPSYPVVGAGFKPAPTSGDHMRPPYQFRRRTARTQIGLQRAHRLGQRVIADRRDHEGCADWGSGQSMKQVK